MTIAIVTGASSGLGRGYIQEINRQETGIEEIWAIARREDRLEALKAESTIPVRPVSMDLTEQKSMERLSQILSEEKPRVKLLINAAGFGKIGKVEEIGPEANSRMVDLNCRAAVEITCLVLPYMEAGDRIMEICSTAAFQPFQFLSVYSASKAFLYSFSRSLRVELFPRRIKVTAVCPYWVRDTEFIPVAKETEDGGRAIRHFPLSSRSGSVVSMSLRDSRLGLAVSTPGIVCTVHRLVAKVIPYELMMGIWALLRRV